MQDRLLRFGSERLFRIWGLFHVEVIVLNTSSAVSPEQQFAEDLVEFLTAFSSRRYVPGAAYRNGVKKVPLIATVTSYPVAGYPFPLQKIYAYAEF